MYEPPLHKNDNLPELHALIRDRVFGLLISNGAEGLIANSVPFVLDPSGSKLGVLKVHLARANPANRAASSTIASSRKSGRSARTASRSASLNDWHDELGSWFRSYGNENWEFDEDGSMRVRLASINDLPIREQDRLYHWPLGSRRTIIPA